MRAKLGFWIGLGAISVVLGALLFQFWRSNEIRLDPRVAISAPQKKSLRFSHEKPAATDVGESVPQAMATKELKEEAQIQHHVDVLVSLLEQGRDSEFLQQLDRLLAQSPQQPDLLALQADYYYMKQNWVGAESALQRLVAVEPDNHFAQSSLGEIQGILGKFDESMKNFNDVLSKEPGRLEALYGIISVSELSGNPQVGIEQVKSLAREHSDIANIQLVLADILYSEGKSVERDQVLQDLIRRHPEEPGAYRFLANDALRRQDYKTAAKLAQESLRRDRDPETRNDALEVLKESALRTQNVAMARKIILLQKESDPSNETYDLQIQQIDQKQN